MKALISWDIQALKFLNLSLAHPWIDLLMKAWSAEWPWFSLLFIFVVRVSWCKDWSRLYRVLWIGVTIGVSDLVAHNIVKPLSGRLRPCRVEGLVRIVDGCSGWFSFPSNHASNAAVFACLCFLLLNRRLGLLAGACAVSIGVSRVYLGVHYPSDVLGGYIFGSTLAMGSYLILLRSPFLKRWPLAGQGKA